MHWHMEDTIVVLKEGPGTHPWCNNCKISINQEEMAAGHLGTTMFKRGGNCKHHHLSATASQVEAGTEFRAQDQVLEKLDTYI